MDSVCGNDKKQFDPDTSKITIRGARQHNLKSIDLDLPRNKFIVITGLSGSGKSSLAFDTIYAEGQRRYLETMMAYARQFLQILERPDVDLIEGLSPPLPSNKKQSAPTHTPQSEPLLKFTITSDYFSQKSGHNFV